MSSSKEAVVPIPCSSCIRRLFQRAPARERPGRRFAALPGPTRAMSANPNRACPRFSSGQPRSLPSGPRRGRGLAAPANCSIPSKAAEAAGKDAVIITAAAPRLPSGRPVPPPSRARKPPQPSDTPLPRPGPTFPAHPAERENPSPRRPPTGPSPRRHHSSADARRAAGPRRPAPQRGRNSADDYRRALRRPAAVFVLSASS